MATLKVSGLSKSFGIKTVFQNVSFELKTGERIGLVGANGAGKTTLLKCILGTEEPDAGSVKASDGAIIGYLRQDFNYTSHTIREEMEKAWKDVLHYQKEAEELSKKLSSDGGNPELLREYGRVQGRFEAMGGYEYEAATRKILTGLGFTDKDWDRDIQGFSGGQKVRINLASAFVRNPDFLLLDEPTNHLDMNMLEWLEDYLRSFRGGILMISHDRYFLDAAATGIIDLAHHHIRQYRGGYTRFVKTKAELEAAHEKAYEKQQEHIAKTEEYIRKYKAGIKAKQARGRQSQLDRLERIEKVEHDKELQFEFEKPAMSAEKVLDVMHVSASYGAKHVFQDLSLHIKRGERVGLIGPNGSGKSTLLKLITGEKQDDSGIIQLGNRVKIGYYSQEQEHLHPQLTVLEEIRDTFNYGEGEARNVLGRFLFQGDSVFKKISLLSGGEKARLSLLCILLENPNFLILDEPTNHLDIPTREMIEKAVLAFGGTSLIVSHDRYFLDKVTTRILELDQGKLTEYLGNYSYYKEKKKDLAAFEADRAAGKAEPETKKKAAPPEKPKEENAQNKKTPPGDQAKIDHVEMEISRLEATLEMYTVEMSRMPENYEEYAREYDETKKKLDELYKKWDELASKISGLM